MRFGDDSKSTDATEWIFEVGFIATRKKYMLMVISQLTISVFTPECQFANKKVLQLRPNGSARWKMCTRKEFKCRDNSCMPKRESVTFKDDCSLLEKTNRRCHRICDFEGPCEGSRIKNRTHQCPFQVTFKEAASKKDHPRDGQRQHKEAAAVIICS